MATRRIVTLAAGWVCLVSAALNWWNMAGVGVTVWRILLASTITLIGLYLLVFRFRAGRNEREGKQQDTAGHRQRP